LSTGRLTSLQTAVLTALADISPRWVLTGGGCLAGFHLAHRTTRDLDLFFRGERVLAEGVTAAVVQHLEAAGLVVKSLTRSPAFARYSVETADERTLLDLVAEPVASVEPPLSRDLPSATVLIDTAHEVLTNKLTALISREELRDLVDLEALLGTGLPLERGLADAPKKDAGFSPLILARLLDTFPIDRLNRLARLPESDIERLRLFARSLSDECLRVAMRSLD